MHKKLMLTAVLSLLLMVLGDYQVSAEAKDREEVLSLVKEAQSSQRSISEEARSLDQIKNKLGAYFTKNAVNRFIKANVTKTDSGYTALGSDFAPEYVPFFTYGKETKVIYEKDGQTIYVQEEFPSETDGPVAAEEHFQSVTLVKEAGSWKVQNVDYQSEDKEQAVKKNEEADDTAAVIPAQLYSFLYNPANKWFPLAY